MRRSSSEYIALREIDGALLQHPAVLEAAVVGIPDRHFGHEIMACIEPRAVGSKGNVVSDSSSLHRMPHRRAG